MVWTSVEFDAHEQVCHFSDESTGLRAIVAIHSTALGPAVGGTRFKPYPDEAHALDDALRLSRAMSYKAALAGLPMGGGKGVIIGDPGRIKTRDLLQAYGRFINRIGSVFATGEDIGMSVADVEAIAEVTPYVGGTSSDAGDPAVHTATGVIHGLRTVVTRRFGRSDFQGLRVALQGLGAVGGRVARELHAEGATLTVADVRPATEDAARREFGATVVPTEQIHAADVDLFVPCALGGVVTERTARDIRAGAVAGAANNQLSSPEAGRLLFQRGVLFAPDYVLNAGGIISGLAATTRMPGRQHAAFPPLDEALLGIGTRLGEIFERSAAEARAPEATAEAMARELIGRPA